MTRLAQLRLRGPGPQLQVPLVAHPRKLLLGRGVMTAGHQHLQMSEEHALAVPRGLPPATVPDMLCQPGVRDVCTGMARHVSNLPVPRTTASASVPDWAVSSTGSSR